jgi:hypothetical protein
MSTAIRTRTVFAALALTGSMVAFSAAAANAAAQPQAQPSWCGWMPANDSFEPGEVLQAPLNLRTGQGTECNLKGTITSTGWNLTIRCQTSDGSWYYVDSPAGTGWVTAGDVSPIWDSPVNC